MTPDQIKAEKAYRIEERLGMLCGAGKPTPEQMRIAVEEAQQWERDYKALSVN